MPPILFVPLGQSRSHMHLLDDLTPAHTGVVRTERDLTFLSRIRDDALLGAAEVIVEQILKPHSCYEQEVPSVCATPLDVLNGSITRYLAVVLARSAKGLVEFLQKVRQPEVRRRFVWIVVSHQRERHSRDG